MNRTLEQLNSLLVAAHNYIRFMHCEYGSGNIEAEQGYRMYMAARNADLPAVRGIAGHYFKTRDGETVGPLERIPEGPFKSYSWTDRNKVNIWVANGQAWAGNEWPNHPRDLIEDLGTSP